MWWVKAAAGEEGAGAGRRSHGEEGDLFRAESGAAEYKSIQLHPVRRKDGVPGSAGGSEAK